MILYNKLLSIGKYLSVLYLYTKSLIIIVLYHDRSFMYANNEAICKKVR